MHHVSPEKPSRPCDGQRLDHRGPSYNTQQPSLFSEALEDDPGDGERCRDGGI